MTIPEIRDHYLELQKMLYNMLLKKELHISHYQPVVDDLSLAAEPGVGE